jgi:hypothetical protein
MVLPPRRHRGRALKKAGGTTRMAYSVVENRFRRHCDRRSAPVNERLFPFASARSALPRALRLRARRLAFTFPRSPIRSPRAFPRTREAWKTAAATNTTPGIPVFPAPTAMTSMRADY